MNRECIGKSHVRAKHDLDFQATRVMPRRNMTTLERGIMIRGLGGG